MDYRTILRTNGVDIATLSPGSLTAIVNAMHAAYSAGYVSGYSAALSVEHRPHGLS